MEAEIDLLGPFTQLLDDVSTPAQVRAAEPGGDFAQGWERLVESGFLDALVPERHGGAGLEPRDVLPLIFVSGEYLLPAPLAETMFARALLASIGVDAIPDRPITLWPLAASGYPCSLVAPLYSVSALALVSQDNDITLRELVPDQRDGFLLLPGKLIDAVPKHPSFAAVESDLLPWTAAITAALISGAMNRVLAMALAHANDREQFGRPLGKFQAIQHQLAVMAEQVAMATMAVRTAFDCCDRFTAGMAKCLVGEAATIVCAGAHAVFGAIGISEEHDLQLYMRRIKRWQLSFGDAGFWAGEIGSARLKSDAMSLDFVRGRLADSRPRLTAQGDQTP